MTRSPLTAAMLGHSLPIRALSRWRPRRSGRSRRSCRPGVQRGDRCAAVRAQPVRSRPMLGGPRAAGLRHRTFRPARSLVCRGPTFHSGTGSGLSKVCLRWRQLVLRRAGWTERRPAMKLICVFFAALTVLLGSHDGFAQSAYPDRAIRILVGFPPGGPPDIAARLLAAKFAEAWGKPVVVENATGAGGNVAVERAAKATPDGYTLVMASSAITINPSLYEKLPYDPVKDLAP